VLILGCLLVVVAIVLRLADWDHLSSRMPTQVPPPAVQAGVLVVGVILVCGSFLR